MSCTEQPLCWECGGGASEEGLRSRWQEGASRAKVWGGVSRQREQLLQSPQDRQQPRWLCEGPAGSRLAIIESPGLDHRGGGSRLERFRASATRSDLSFEKQSSLLPIPLQEKTPRRLWKMA